MTDIDFILNTDFSTQKIPGTDTFPTVFVYSDCKNGFYTSMNPPGDGMERTGRAGCCGCDTK